MAYRAWPSGGKRWEKHTDHLGKAPRRAGDGEGHGVLGRGLREGSQAGGLPCTIAACRAWLGRDHRGDRTCLSPPASVAWGRPWHSGGLQHSIAPAWPHWPPARAVWSRYPGEHGTPSCSWFTSRALIRPSVHLQPPFYRPNPSVSPSCLLAFPPPSPPEHPPASTCPPPRIASPSPDTALLLTPAWEERHGGAPRWGRDRQPGAGDHTAPQHWGAGACSPLTTGPRPPCGANIEPWFCPCCCAPTPRWQRAIFQRPAAKQRPGGGRMSSCYRCFPPA